MTCVLSHYSMEHMNIVDVITCLLVLLIIFVYLDVSKSMCQTIKDGIFMDAYLKIVSCVLRTVYVLVSILVTSQLILTSSIFFVHFRMLCTDYVFQLSVEYLMQFYD